MKFIPLNIFAITLLFIASNCSSQKGNQTQETSKWKSEYHNLKAEFDKPWELIPSTSTQKKTIFGLIDKNDGKSYVVKITSDVSKDILSDLDYYEASKQLMLNENSENTIVDECKIQFHGEIFHRQIFIMHTAKWGVLKQYAYTRRTGKLAYSVQIAFPANMDNGGKYDLPEQIKSLDKNILLDNK